MLRLKRAGPAANSACSHSEKSHHRRPKSEAGRSPEPIRLVEMRFDGEGPRGTLLVPNTLVVASNHAEGVVACRQHRIADITPRTDIHPTRIQWRKLNFETHPFGRQQAGCGEINRDVTPAWRHLRGRGNIDLGTAHGGAFDVNLRSQRIGHDTAWIDDFKRAIARKIKPPRTGFKTHQ